MAFFKTFTEIRKRAMKLNDTFPDYPVNKSTSNAPCQPFPVYLNDSKFKGHIDTLKDLSKNFITSLKPTKLTPNQTENFKSVIDEYTEDHSRLSIHQTKIILIGSIITIILLVIYTTWLTIKYNKLYQMVMALSVCISLTEGYECPADDPPPVVICQDTWFSVLPTAISILAMIFYVYRLCKSQTFCKGHILGKTMTFYLVICQETRYCPIKLSHGRSLNKT